MLTNFYQGQHRFVHDNYFIRSGDEHMLKKCAEKNTKPG
jgi:hypothetical protein